MLSESNDRPHLSSVVYQSPCSFKGATCEASAKRTPPQSEYRLFLSFRYRLLRSWFASTQHWCQFDPFFAQKEDTFKSSGTAVYSECPIDAFMLRGDPHIWVPELAWTMAELDQEAAQSSLATDVDRLEILFDEMIQMCLWSVLRSTWDVDDR